MIDIITDKFKQVDNQGLRRQGMKPQLGRVFQKNGEKHTHVMYCPICRTEVSVDDAAVSKLVAEGKWDWRKGRMLYCGKNSLCSDWMHEHMQWKKKENEEAFHRLKVSRIIA